MEFSEYQEEALKTAIYPKEIGVLYCALGLCGEAGEVAEKIKKIYRDKQGKLSIEDFNDLKKELGDVLWYINAIAGEMDCSLEGIAIENLNKLKSRAEIDVIQGSGDNR